MGGLCYIGLEILSCISFPSQWRGDCDAWVIRLGKKCVCPTKHPLWLSFLKRLLFSRSRLLENPLRLGRSIAMWLFWLFLSWQLQVLLAFWFCFLNGRLKNGKYAVKFPMQGKHDIYSFSMLSLSTDEFKMKSNSMKLTISSQSSLFVHLFSWKIVCWDLQHFFGVSIPFNINNNCQSWKRNFKRRLKEISNILWTLVYFIVPQDSSVCSL